MRNYIINGVVGLSMAGMMAGCGQTIPGIQAKSSFNECANINKKLLQTDEYLLKVDQTSAFYLEEAAIALENPRMSTSSNKKDMLKDANNRKDKLLADSKKYGCEPYKK